MPTKQIKGFILAGSQREYYYYLCKARLKGSEYPRITLFVQLQHYHDVPPITCVGSYSHYDKFREIWLRAKAAGVDVTDVTIKQ
jgi:hypothetical protein